MLRWDSNFILVEKYWIVEMFIDNNIYQQPILLIKYSVNHDNMSKYMLTLYTLLKIKLNFLKIFS